MSAVTVIGGSEQLQERRRGVAANRGVWISWRGVGAPATDAAPLLMIMGLAASSRGWYRLLPHLARDRECVVFDNRGTGYSDRPRGPYSMEDFVGDTLSVMDAAGLERPHVIGASMGGMIALQLALAVPERVRSLTLACTTAGGGRGAPRALAAMALRPLLGIRRTFEMTTPIMYSRRTRTQHPERLEQDFERRLLDATPAASVMSQMAAIARHDVRDRLGELTAPTLVIHGLEDGMVPADRGRALAEGIRGARLRLLPDTAHILGTDAEEETAGAIGEFLEEMDR
jgi:pimeloyl-ACP methyl ester carboxylesterase